MSYNNRLQVSEFEATEPGSTVDFASKAAFSYLADGRTSAKDDIENNAFDRTFKYDFAGRLSFNQFGVDAGTSKRVYEQSASYDSYSNLTARATVYWDEQNDMDAEFTNGRITSDNTVVYDAAGNIVSKGSAATLRTDTFDASGRRTSSKDRWASSGGQGATVNERQTDHIADADGRPVIEKLGARQYSPTPGTLTMAVYKYQVWSSVLGQAVAVMDNAGNQVENRVYMGGTLLATSWGRHTTGTSADDAIHFFASDPVTDTKVTYAYNATTSNWSSEEKEPFGQNVSSIDPYIEEWNNYSQVQNGAQDPEWQCTLHEKTKGAFGRMPFHCQKIAMQADFIIEKRDKYADDNIAGLNQSPTEYISRNYKGSSSDNILKTASRSTDKPEGGDCVAKLADGTSVPGKVGSDGRCHPETIGPTVYGSDEEKQIVGTKSRSKWVTSEWGNYATLQESFVYKSSGDDIPQSSIDAFKNWAQPSPCDVISPLSRFRPVFRQIEYAIGRDVLPDGISVQFSYMGASIGVRNTRTGLVAVTGEGTIDPVNLYVAIPQSVKNAGRLAPSVSITAQKIGVDGNLSDNRIDETLTGTSITFGGGYKLYGGVELSNLSERRPTLVGSAGLGFGANLGGVSHGYSTGKGCFSW